MGVMRAARLRACRRAGRDADLGEELQYGGVERLRLIDVRGVAGVRDHDFAGAGDLAAM